MKLIATLSLGSALLLGPALVPLGLCDTAGAAATLLCQGREATVVGTPGETVVGTEGDDVIVTSGARRAYGLDGDDLVCATGSTSNSYLHTGDGDDTVIATQATAMRTKLGDGDDSFVGGDGRDLVSGGGGRDNPGTPDDGADVITTGGGDDGVVSGQDEWHNDDSIDLGAGDDSLILRSADGGTVAGGAGRDLLSADGWGSAAAPTAWVLDNRTGTGLRDGVVSLRWSGLERFAVGRIGRRVDLTFMGGDQDEEFDDTDAYASSNSLTARMGGGDDDVLLGWRHRGDIRGQGGDNRLLLAGADSYGGGNPPRPTRPAVVRLDRGWSLMSRDPGRRFVTTGFTVVETFEFGTTSVTGSSRPDQIVVHNSCRVRVDGRRGADVVTRTSANRSCLPRDLARATLLRGGPDDDRLRGAATDDVLLGGSGRDAAYGRGGRDRCSAETTLSCETR